MNRDEDFFLTEMFRSLNSFFLNGFFGLCKYLWLIAKKVPHWTYDLFRYGPAWVWRQLKTVFNFIFRGSLFRFVVQVTAFLPSMALFILALAWPFVGWYLTGKIDMRIFAAETKWYWLVSGVVWTLSIGWFGIRYGIRNCVFDNAADRLKELCLTKKERARRRHERLVEEEKRKNFIAQQFESRMRDEANIINREYAKMIDRNKQMTELRKNHKDLLDLMQKYHDKSISSDDMQKLRDMCIKSYDCSPDGVDIMIDAFHESLVESNFITR